MGMIGGSGNSAKTNFGSVPIVEEITYDSGVHTSQVFPVSQYTSGLINVSVNGIQLSKADFIAVDGTTVQIKTLAQGGIDLITGSVIDGSQVIDDSLPTKPTIFKGII